MDIIEKNPYRLLGIYATSTAKERLANASKLNAFLKVGKSPDFPLDLNGYLPHLERTLESVSEAEARLTLPKEQLKYALFWFVHTNSFDEVAFNHLFQGDMTAAQDIWQKKVSASSLQNLLVCYLIHKDEHGLISCAEPLYSTYADALLEILGSKAVSADELGKIFLDVLEEEWGSMRLLRFVAKTRNTGWQEYVKAKAVAPLVEEIRVEMEAVKSAAQSDPEGYYKRGKEFLKKCLPLLEKLKQLLPPSDPEYQAIADKLGLAILQCGINFFNASDTTHAITKRAMELQEAAQDIVVGALAKERCKENVNILKQIIDKLPPEVISSEMEVITSALNEFQKGGKTIAAAQRLLTNTQAALRDLAEKIGTNNGHYLQISTAIAAAALSATIDEVNRAQERFMLKSHLEKDPFSILERLKLDRARPYSRFEISELEKLYQDPVSRLEYFKDVLSSAWLVMVMIGTLYLDSDFRKERYEPNRKTLKGLCDSVGVSTSKTFWDEVEENLGCLVPIIIIVVIGLLVSLK